MEGEGREGEGSGTRSFEWKQRNDRRLTTGGNGRQTISAALHQVLSVNDHNASCKPIRVKAAIRMPGHASPWITFTPSPSSLSASRCFHWPANDFRCTQCTARRWFTLRRHRHNCPFSIPSPPPPSPSPLKSCNRVADYRESAWDRHYR